MAEVANTSGRDDFLEWIETTLRPAEAALHDGDPGPRLTIWSTHEPVSVLGAWRNALGRPAVEDLFHALGESFSDSSRCEMEILAADVVGDMAYTVAIERMSTSVNGAPAHLRAARHAGVPPRGRRLARRPPSRRRADRRLSCADAVRGQRLGTP